MNAEELITKLLNYYKVYTISELSEKIGIGQPAISKWKINNSIKTIKKKCIELGIYNDIFGDINTHTQYLKTNSGINSFNNYGTQTIDEQDLTNDIDLATLNLFKEAYEKSIKNDDLKGLRLHLMDY